MKKLLPILFAFVSVSAFSQVQELWTKSFDDAIVWQKVSALGHYVIGTSKGIMGVKPETGDVIWTKNELGPVSEEQVKQVGNSPLISVNIGTEIHMVDPFTGKTKFNSKAAGVESIRDQVVLYKANGILVSGRDAANKDILLMSSLNTGDVVWKIQEDYGRMITANEISAEELLIVTLFHNYKVNPQSGKVIWKNDVSEANKQMSSLGAIGGLMKTAVSNMAQDMEFEVEFYQKPDGRVFYIASEQEVQSSMSTSSSSGNPPPPSYETSYTAFSMDDGSRLWKEPLVVKGTIGPVYFDDQGMAILPDNGSSTKINLYDYNSQEGKWGKKGKGIKVKGGIYSYTKVGKGLILVSRNPSGKNYISYLDLESGLLTFDKPVKIDGNLVFSEVTPKGLLYATTEEVNILDQSQGTLLLPKSIPTRPSLTAQDKDVLYAFDVKANMIKSIEKSSGEVKTVSPEIEFDGKEDPNSLVLRESGLLLGASQNFALVDRSGSIVYQNYHEAPREAGIIRALRYAQAVRAAYIGAASYMGSAAYTAAAEDVKEDDPVAGAMAEGIGQAYGELGDAATDFAVESFKQAQARFKATKEGDDYVAIMTRPEKEVLLLKMNKDTGKTEGTIGLGKDKEPSYAMDGVTGYVFYRDESRVVKAYKF